MLDITDTCFNPVDEAEAPSEQSSLQKALTKLQKKKGLRVDLTTIQPAQASLPFWSEDVRGMPNSLIRGALFTAAKGGKDEQRSHYKNKVISTLRGIKLEYRGEELRQDDNSVFLALLHFGRNHELGQPIPFTAFAMLKELGWSKNSDEYKHLRECCERLSATNVKVSYEKNSTDGGTAGYSGSLVRAFEWQDGGESLAQWYVLLEPSIARLFTSDSFTLLDHSIRRKIGGRSPLALWLHSFLCTHREPFAISVAKYHELCGSRSDDLNDFRRRLKLALMRLKDEGFLKDFQIKMDVVYVTRMHFTKNVLKMCDKTLSDVPLLS
jgi:hypothetical protein